ncbi:MBL fold metallo-hydrolase [Arenicella xantha]|uniref:Phosphoribosyl 1,2-cyclic phosphodiesterase n=1 Tax=Arenicella xantha TaxID=644221 RepID=A0A395JEV4_9GAMM|nr:MBL fold metallo-hydrolase [Arenicella xantha]RBP47149.1 phosphoribosyl 1,2-cyclic phosphodiesterase [Arenicella xantha]
MAGDINNLRIHFYGVQGSGSVYPRRAERHLMRERTEVELLERVFALLKTQSTAESNQNNVAGNGSEAGSTAEALALAEILSAESIAPERIKSLWEKIAPPEAPSYGGWTSCFRLETSDGYDIVFDCGSGFRLCAQDLELKWSSQASRSLTIFGTHAHFDHTEGFDQADVCFNPANHIHVYGNASYLNALDHYLGVFSHKVDKSEPGRQTPLTYELMPADFEATELRDLSKDKSNKSSDELGASEADSVAQHIHDWNQPVWIGKTKIQAFEVFHPDPCLAYRIEHNGKVFVYCTDHELRHGPNPEYPPQVESVDAERRLREFAKDADVVYRDGQFLRAEYDGDKSLDSGIGTARRDWGHSCIEDVVEMAQACNIRRTYIGHHDPSRSWQEKVEIDEMLKQHCTDDQHIELAKGETVIDL